MSDASDITQIHRQSSFLVQDPSKPTGAVIYIDYFPRAEKPYHLIRMDAAGRHDLDSYFTREQARGGLQTALKAYDPGWVRFYTPPDRQMAQGGRGAPTPQAHHQPTQKAPKQPHHFQRPAKEKPQHEHDKRQQHLGRSDTRRPPERPEQRSQRSKPSHERSNLVFEGDEGGRITGKPMDLAEALKARREASGLGWSDVAKEYDVQFREQWQKFRHQGDVQFWKEMGERSAVSAAGALGGVAGEAVAGAAVAGLGLSGITEGALVGGASGMASSAAMSGSQIAFGHRMSAASFGAQVVIGGIFGVITGGIGAKLLGPKTAPAPVSEPPAPVITRWKHSRQLDPHPWFHGPYYHFVTHGTTVEEIVESRVLMGTYMGTGTGPQLPSANASRGHLQDNVLGVEFYTRTKPRPTPYIQATPDEGVRWTQDLPGVRTGYKWSERFGEETEHAVVDIFVTRYTVRDPVTNKLVMRAGPYDPPPNQ